MRVTVTVNGSARSADVEPRTLLVHLLRETLGLTGTNVGCDTTSCGACTVHLDGRSVKSCTVLAVQADGSEVTTIEGMAMDGELHPMQRAFMENHGLQCGYCTPGMVMASTALIAEAQADGTTLDEQPVQRQRFPSSPSRTACSSRVVPSAWASAIRAVEAITMPGVQ